MIGSKKRKQSRITIEVKELKTKLLRSLEKSQQLKEETLKER